MGHIQDRWYRKVFDPDSKRLVRVKTSLYGKGMRYKVRYLAPDGTEKSKMYPDKCKGDAEDFLSEVESKIRGGNYVDPDAGKVTFKSYALKWLEAQTFDESTREITGTRLNSMIFPYLGDRNIGDLRPTDVRGWTRWMQQRKAASSYQAVCFAHVSAIFTAAVDDKIVTENPCQARSVSRPKPDERKVVPWTRSRVKKIRMAMPEQYKIMVPIGAGLGLRQGEIFGLGADQIDRDEMVLHVVRQLKMIRGQLVFALPKRRKTRDVPLSAGLLRLLDDHIQRFPPVTVTLPWESPDGAPTTVDLLVTAPVGGPLQRRHFNLRVWQVACRAAGITAPTREDGMHALRHHYASVLLDAGESIKALSTYLGHTDPGFTLRTYTHLMPSSAERTRKAIDQEWGSGDEGQGAADGLETA